MPPLLRTDGVDVRFGGLQALSDADVAIEPGRVTGLIGPNGAGKTTLFNVITGLQEPTAGTVHLEDEDITHLGVHQRARRGISRTFQKLEAFNSLSTHDNILVASEIRSRWSKDKTSASDVADEVIDQVGLGDVSHLTVGTLPTGTARLVELARALATRPKVLLLDEPSSGLNEDETSAMGTLLLRLVDDGLAVLLVEHDMPFVMGVCSHIHVLDFGHVIATGSPDEIRQNPEVLAAYLGADA